MLQDDPAVGFEHGQRMQHQASHVIVIIDRSQHAHQADRIEALCRCKCQGVRLMKPHMLDTGLADKGTRLCEHFISPFAYHHLCGMLCQQQRQLWVRAADLQQMPGNWQSWQYL
nr:hypothetical protein [Pseudomonas sp. NEEL19]